MTVAARRPSRNSRPRAAARRQVASANAALPTSSSATAVIGNGRKSASRRRLHAAKRVVRVRSGNCVGPLEVAVARPQRPDLRRRAADPLGETARMREVEAHDAPVAGAREEPIAEGRVFERRVGLERVRAGVADPLRVEAELRHVGLGRRRVRQRLVEEDLVERGGLERARRAAAVPERRRGRARAPSRRRASSSRRANRNPESRSPSSARIGAWTASWGFEATKSAAAEEVRGGEPSVEPAPPDRRRRGRRGEQQEEERRGLAVEGVERPGVADVREEEDQQRGGDALRGRGQIAAGPHERGRARAGRARCARPRGRGGRRGLRAARRG